MKNSKESTTTAAAAATDAETTPSGRVRKITPPQPPAWDEAAAVAIEPPIRHEHTGKTACWTCAGWYFTAGYQPIAPVPEAAGA